jgi:hypothetical protein
LTAGYEPGAVRRVWKRMPKDIVIADRAGIVSFLSLICDQL